MMIGNYLDQYLITARLGSGSLGETYLAESVLDQSPVVLKLINPELAAKPGLLNKIAKLGKLNAPYTLPFTHEASGGQQYLLMLEYFPDSLQSYLAKLRLKGDDMGSETAVSLILHLISRLHQIDYSQLSIHGGLHPRNMLVKFEAAAPEIILADFLQTDMVRQATAADEQPVRGLAPFTPPWLWPDDEDAIPHKADSRSDLFALGHLLYFLLKNEYVHVSKEREENQDIDDKFQKLIKDIEELEENKEKVDLADYAELAALTAVRLHPDMLPDTPNTLLWQQWHHALLTMSRGEFSLTQIKSENADEDAEEASKTDAIWQITDPLDFLQPDVPEVQFDLPSIESEESAPRVPLQEERPSDDETYVEITRPGAANGDRQTEKFYKIRPGQGFITIGNHTDKDICLPQDAHIGPHHLNIRRVGASWQLFARGSGIALDSAPIAPNQPEVWLPNVPLTIGSYCLYLHQPEDATTEQLIALELLPAQLILAPGFKGKVGISIRNYGNERSYFKVDKEDLGTLDRQVTEQQAIAEEQDEEEDHWFTLPQDGLVLNPGEQQELLLQVHPPLNQASQTRLFQITVRRLGQSSQKATIQGRIFLQTNTDFTTHLDSDSSQTNGAYRLIIRNKSNKSQTYEVNSTDSLRELEFAAVDTAVERPQPDEEELPSTQTSRTNGSGQPHMANSQVASRLLRRTGLGGQINSAVSEARRQQRNIQWALREAGSIMPKSRLKFPEVAPGQLQFNETYQVEEIVPPSEQAVIFFRVRPRKWPFRYQPDREIPFTLTITPLLGTEEEARQETAVLHVPTRFSRPSWTLLIGLGLLIGLLFIGCVTFRTSRVASAFLATQDTARIYGSADIDGDSIPSYLEVSLYHTNPEVKDTDGDGMSDGLEISIDDRRICPTKIDCNGNGISDPVEIGFATPTPTPPGGFPFVTAEPPPTATPIPTVTPTRQPVAQLQPSQTVSLLYSNSEKALTLGDDPNNQQQIIEMSFNTANRLPAEAIIQEAVLFVVIDNPEQYDRLRQELGNVYVTEGTVPSQEQLGGLTFGSLDEIEGFEQMSLVDNTVNVLKTKLPALNRGLSSIVTVRLFFELGSDLDGQEDLLRIWSKFDQQASLKEENPPTLIIVYSLPGNSP